MPPEVEAHDPMGVGEVRHEPPPGGGALGDPVQEEDRRRLRVAIVLVVQGQVIGLQLHGRAP